MGILKQDLMVSNKFTVNPGRNVPDRKTLFLPDQGTELILKNSKMRYFKGKVVWITGASSGIGEALAHNLALQGARLILSSRNATELERVKKSTGIREGDVLILPLDLAHTDQINELTRAVLTKFGRIDVLINNGGISQRSYVSDTPIEIDRRIMEVNFFGTVALTKSVLPHMIKQKSGHIAVVSSITGKFGFYLRSAYAASKHALHGFFESLRLEVGKDNISVLLVCPGKIATHISVNALLADGSASSKMDEGQVKGLSADYCASQILKGISNHNEELFIGQPKERFALWLKRISPSAFSRMIRRQKIE
jgi:short-subunit dehydrogenase